MNRDDPFTLPDGYGGVSSSPPASASAASPAPRRTLADLEAELRAEAAGRSPHGTAPSAQPAAPPTRGTDPLQRARRWLDGQIGRFTRHHPAPPPPLGADGTLAPAVPLSPWRRRWPWIKRGLIGFAALLVVTIGWLALTAPLSKSLRPIAPPQLTLTSADGRPIARNGAIVADPIVISRLPPHVVQAFLATEDRRFYSHWGVDPVGIGRAMWNRVAHGRSEGGSTITQQLAKFTFLSSDRTISRKAREMLIAVWMEAWLSKDDILSRYLSNAYFGDNVYGLRAASLHYFYRQPERLTLSQATMLAGLVKAPSRLAPTRNLAAAQARQHVVIVGMVDAGYLTPAQAAAIRPATIDHRATSTLPTGTYFADWAMPEARASVQPGYGETRVRTTLDARLQDLARRVTASAGLRGAQVALVAMRPNGEVVAMVGGRDYRASPFNRATQARRQPGSTFKIAVYLAALRAGMRPDSIVEDTPITEGTYRPTNYGGRYRGRITLREAFLHSSNVVAVRLYQQVGGAAVRAAARDLGITSPLPDNASVALGSSGVTLLELTSAFATVAGNYGPVHPHALHQGEAGLVARLLDGQSALPSRVRADLLTLLASTVNEGTGRAARLAIPAYGKTGTTQDGRDALFVGFAGDLVVGVWVGKDDNSPIDGLTGGGVPARIWRDFMAGAIPGAAPRTAPRPAPEPAIPQIFDDIGAAIGTPEVHIDPDKGASLDTRVGGVGVHLDSNGVSLSPADEAVIRRKSEEAAAAAR